MAHIVSTSNWSQALNIAVGELSSGKTVAVPTETVYGLAADATNGEAVAKIFAMKGRPSFNPLICHVDGMVMAEEFGLMNPLASQLATVFWPGPLTLIVPTHTSSPAHDLVTANLETIGLRCPKGFVRKVISALGKPLAAPSANRSGRISPTTAMHVREEYEGEDLLILDDGPCEVGLESTIVKVDGHRLTLLRHGAITAANIEAAVGIRPQEAKSTDGIQAPGMMVSHYAPDAEVQLNCETCGDNSAWLGFGTHPTPQHVLASLNLSPSSNLVEAASNLYSYMKKLDAVDPKTICVAPIPMEELGIAINDRLTRAAAPRHQPLQKAMP